MIEQTPVGDGHVEVTFRLPATEPPGEVSVVGDFNDWQPGVHHLQLTPHGTRAVTVTVPAGTHHFRYLASGAVWCDDDQADAVTPYGSVIHCHAGQAGEDAPARPASRQSAQAASDRRPRSTKAAGSKTGSKRAAKRTSSVMPAASSPSRSRGKTKTTPQ